jgi:ribosomal protein S6E (S10)
MIKKTILLVTAVMIAASSLSHAAKAKSLKITNESNTTYFYKVGNTVKKITGGSSRSFSLKGLKKVKITSGTSKSGNSVKGDKRTYPTLSISQAKANPLFETNPVSGQTTDLTK